MFNYTLIRSNRKTVALYVRPDAGLEVRAPLRMSRAAIDQFVASKESWIGKNLSLVRERNARKAAFALHYGDKLPLRGGEFPISARAGNRLGFDGEQFYMPPELSEEKIRAACVQIYRLAARRILPEKTAEFSKRMGAAPRAVKINSARTRWGSCSAQQNLNFSWRLLMAGDDVIDYVVVHELAHLREMNHGPRFWALVAGVLPDYRERQQRLKLLQKRLADEDWE